VLGSSETFGQLTMTSLSDRVVISSAASNVLIGGGGNSNTLVIGSNLVTVNADFKVLGNVETVYTSELHVTDALVVVAAGAPSNDATVLTSGAGLLVADAASSGTVDERSFRWRAGVLAAFDGSNSPAAGGASNAGCWDVMGGSLRLTASFAAGVGGAYAGQPGKAVAREVSYGWRVNEADESELFKRVLPTSCNGVEADASYRRVLCVGGRAPVSGTSAISLNRSANPW